MSINIKQASMKDVETLLKIERECFTIEAYTKEQIAYLLENPNAVCLVAKVNNEIAGFIIGLIDYYGKAKLGHVYTIDVAVKHRRVGVGLKLLSELERIFMEKGIKTCYLEVRVDNEAARQLYRKQGYVEREPLKDFYFKGVHGIRLTKILRP